MDSMLVNRQLNTIFVFTMLTIAMAPLLLGAVPFESTFGEGDELACYDFTYHSFYYSEEESLLNERHFGGSVLSRNGESLVLREMMSDGRVSGYTKLFTESTTCDAIGHEVMKCFPTNPEVEIGTDYHLRDPHQIVPLLRGEVAAFKFSHLIKDEDQQVRITENGREIYDHQNNEGTTILRFSHDTETELNRTIESWTARRQLVFSINLSGGTRDLPAVVNAVRYHLSTGTERYRVHLEFSQTAPEDCQLATGNLDKEEVFERIIHPDVTFTLREVDKQGIEEVKVMYEGEWITEEESREIALEAARQNPELLLVNPSEPNEEIEGYGSGWSRASAFFVIGGAGLLFLVIMKVFLRKPT